MFKKLYYKLLDEYNGSTGHIIFRDPYPTTPSLTKLIMFKVTTSFIITIAKIIQVFKPRE